MSTMRYIYVADVILETQTALSLGSGEHEHEQDNPVRKDWNKLPIIMGTSTTGVLKRLYTHKDNDIDTMFGYQEKEKDNGVSSQLRVSNALLLYDKDGTDCVLEEKVPTSSLPDFLKQYLKLPLREHTAINHRGVADRGTKHDKEIVYKGSRFKLRIKMDASESCKYQKEKFESILALLYDGRFRLGAKTTAGLGSVKPVSIHYGCFDKTGREYYNLSSSLNQDTGIFADIYEKPTENKGMYIDKSFELSPESFFMFGSGFGSEDGKVDQVTKLEKVVDYPNQKTYYQLLIPASSIKGSLSHRTAYHYNRVHSYFADKININDFEKYLGENNAAVRAIFGAKSKLDSQGEETGHKGNLIIDDSYVGNYSQKIFDHVKIDDFTMGAVSSALFNEMVASIDSFAMRMLIKNESEWTKKNTVELRAFASAISDMEKGWLALGGMSGRGHGVFTKVVSKGVSNG